MKKALVFILLLSITIFSIAQVDQDCGCTHTIEESGTIKAEDFNYKPGAVFCIKAGIYGYFRFIGFKGSKSQPLIFKNCGGKVVINEDTYPGLQFRESQYIRISGAGFDDIDYGIKIAKAKSSGISISDFSSDVEIRNVEVTNTGFACIVAKTDPDCFDESAWLGNFVMENLHFHHNYLHDNNEGEGFYIGYTSNYELGKTVNCKLINPITNDVTIIEKTLFGHLVKHVELNDNRIVNMAWDGLQVSQGVEDVKIHDNVINGYGLLEENSQNKGLALGSGTTARVYNNTIIGWEKSSHGISNFGLGPVYIFNNLVVNAGESGIYSDHQNSIAPGKGYFIANNTIINPGQYGIWYNNGANNLMSDYECYNNIIVNPGIYDVIKANESNNWKEADKESYLNYKDKESKAISKRGNNLTTRSIDYVKFINPADNNFGLKSNSPAINYGRTSVLQEYGYSTDMIGLKREGGVSAGALEYSTLNSFYDKINNQKKVSIYPNPSSSKGEYVIKTSGIETGYYRISALPLNGAKNKVLFDQVYLSSGDNELVVNATNQRLSPGFYLVRIDGDNYFEVVKLQIK